MIEADQYGNYTVIIKGDLINGKLILPDTIPLRNELNLLREGMVQVTVKRWSEKRSNKQNKLFWLWLRVIADSTGYTPLQVKSILQYKFLFVDEYCEKTGDIIPRIRSTSELSKKEFTEFMDNVNLWASEYLKLDLPKT